MRKALENNQERLDEALLSNAFAWIRKCSEDGFDTMAQLIQKVRECFECLSRHTPREDPRP